MRVASDPEGLAAVPGAEAVTRAPAATPANGEVHAVAGPAISACFNTEVQRWHADWRCTLTGVRDALAGLDRTCEAAIHSLAEAEVAPPAALATLVGTLVAAATVDADAAAQRARAEAHREIADLQALVDRLHAEVHAAREQAQIARAEGDAAQRARECAEAARAEAQHAYAELVAASEAQRHRVQTELDAARAESRRLHQQLEAEHGERARLIAALHTVQRAVSFAEPGGLAADLPDPLLPPRHAVPGLAAASAPAPEAALTEARAVSDAPDGAAAADPPVNRTLTLVSPAPIAGAEAHFEPVVYLQQLLEEIEGMYGADLESALSPVDVAKGLAANLGYARDLFERRLRSAGVADPMLFERQLTMWLDTKSATSFGRQLAIAASESGLIGDVRSCLSPMFRRAGDR